VKYSITRKACGKYEKLFGPKNSQKWTNNMSKHGSGRPPKNASKTSEKEV
jgi:hypothetical protein